MHAMGRDARQITDHELSTLLDGDFSGSPGGQVPSEFAIIRSTVVLAPDSPGDGSHQSLTARARHCARSASRCIRRASGGRGCVRASWPGLRSSSWRGQTRPWQAPALVAGARWWS